MITEQQNQKGQKKTQSQQIVSGSFQENIP